MLALANRVGKIDLGEGVDYDDEMLDGEGEERNGVWKC